MKQIQAFAASLGLRLVRARYYEFAHVPHTYHVVRLGILVRRRIVRDLSPLPELLGLAQRRGLKWVVVMWFASAQVRGHSPRPRPGVAVLPLWEACSDQARPKEIRVKASAP